MWVLPLSPSRHIWSLFRTDFLQCLEVKEIRGPSVLCVLCCEIEMTEQLPIWDVGEGEGTTRDKRQPEAVCNTRK